MDAPPIMRRRGAGFPDFTITHRLPRIAATAAAVAPAAARPAIQRVVSELIAGGPIDTSVLRRETPFWERTIDGLAGASWIEVPFFDTEFLLYHALNSLAGWFDDGVDVFQPVRAAARTAAVAALAAAPLDDIGDQPPAREQLSNALWMALLGNEADYSQLAPGTGQRAAWSDRLVVDQRADLLDALLRAPGGAAVHLIADNAGPELLADLVLADVLLRGPAPPVVTVHCKPWPMFVSDALPADVVTTIDALAALPSGPARAIGSRLERAVKDGRLRVAQHAAWGEPRHFDALDADLADGLGAAGVVIAKGDLNYRRFVGDRAWPAETPAAVAARDVPFAAHALRVLKSDAVVGVAASMVARAAAADPDWRTSSRFALVQRLGGRAP